MEWFVYGDAVLDRLLGCHRSKRLHVWFRDIVPTRADVEKALAIIGLPIDFCQEVPPSICEFDHWVIDAQGKLRSRDASSTNAPILPIEMVPRHFDIPPVHVIRLNRIHHRYPEVFVDPVLLARIESTVEHLQAIRTSYPALELLFAASDLD